MSMEQQNGLSLGVPPELVDAIAEEVAERLAEKLPQQREGYLNIAEAAQYLSCSTSLIRDLKDRGKLRHYRCGRFMAFRREDLDEVLTIREPEPR